MRHPEVSGARLPARRSLAPLRCLAGFVISLTVPLLVP